jgi:hypothetical protein
MHLLYLILVQHVASKRCRMIYFSPRENEAIEDMRVQPQIIHIYSLTIEINRKDRVVEAFCFTILPRVLILLFCYFNCEVVLKVRMQKPSPESSISIENKAHNPFMSLVF